MNPTNPPAKSAPVSSRPLALAVVFFAVGVALAAAWFHFKHTGAGPESGDALSAQNRNLLAHLEQPVTIRYYAILPANSAAADLQAFGRRVEQLLADIRSAADGKVEIEQLDSTAGTNADAATAAGIQPFNLDKGDACFLGLAISSGAHSETIARLQPQWESALQYDLTRAILRVARSPAPAPLAPEVARPSAEIVNSIHKLVPDVNTTSLQDANRIFHEDFLQQCARVGAETESNLNVAQQKVVQAQQSGSASDLEAARKNLSEVQLAQGEKLKALAARLQTELAVFQQMKDAATNTTK